MDMFITLTIIICIYFYYTNKKEQFTNYLSVEELVPKVYISFTTIPSRIAYIDEMLKYVDILDIHEIHLNLEKHLNYDEYHVERLKKITPKLKVYVVDEKLGPLTKIVPTLERLLGTNSLVISVDDDILYTYQIIKNLINSHNLNTVTGNCEVILTEYSPKIIKKFKNIDNNLHILEGYAGILYPVKLITKNMLNEMKKLTKLSKECYKSDDLIINLVLEKYGVQRKNIYNGLINYIYNDIKILEYSNNDALHLSEHDATQFINGNASNYYYCTNSIIDNGFL